MIDAFKNPRRNAFYIAEIGMNHNGDPEMARAMIRAAAGAGADAVKFQTFVPEMMNSVHTSSLLETGREGKPDRSLIDFFSKFVFGRETYAELKNYADGQGVVFFSSPFDFPSVELLESIGVPLYKIASSEVTNHGLISMIARTGKPAIMSTGISKVEDVDSAVECFLKSGGKDLSILHCVSLYPAPPGALNLRRIVSLRERYGLAVGFSDHSRGLEAVSAAAILGARIFEKHFTVDRNHDCPDKDVSLAPDDFSGMIGAAERAISMLGGGDISYGEAEHPVARAARRSLFAKKFIPRGKTIEADDLIALRPGVGIGPDRIMTVTGRQTVRDIREGDLIRPEDF